MSREQRKIDHIKYALKLGDGPCRNGFEEVHFLHNCLPELAPTDIDTTTRLCDIRLRVPFLVNAITGGTDNVTEINRKLALSAQTIGAAVAVGSQYGAVKEKKNYRSFEIVREVYPEGIIFANVSALATSEEARDAVEMINADALQIHLNSAQELVMPEGDRDFKGLLVNMQHILEHVTVPVIVKETGCGMAAEQIKQLLAAGFSWFDIGGAGGTNFPAIEGCRFTAERNILTCWGIPTAKSLLETASTVRKNSVIFASGGIRDGLSAAKALAFGADAVGMSGNILRCIMKGGVQEAQAHLLEIVNELKLIMLLTGSSDLKSLRKVPLYFTGIMHEFMLCRGYDLREVGSERRK